MKLVKTIINVEKEIVAKNSYDESLSDISNEFLRYKRNYDCPFLDKQRQIFVDFIATNVLLPFMWRNSTYSKEALHEVYMEGIKTIIDYLFLHDNPNYFFLGPKYLDELTIDDIVNMKPVKNILFMTCVVYAAGMLRILKEYSTDIQERYMD